jgi:tRNA C32,U32 (ribose-2'-O)-methylase TrmJ
MTRRIQELESLTKAEQVSPEQFRQLALIVLELAREMESKPNGPPHAGNDEILELQNMTQRCTGSAEEVQLLAKFIHHLFTRSQSEDQDKPHRGVTSGVKGRVHGEGGL